MQNTSHLLMIRPVHFGYNAQTAVNNTFQIKEEQSGVQERALREFDEFVDRLREQELDVTVIDDSAEPHTPDAIFPNNWVSFHHPQTLCLYPMYAPNRRQERKSSVLAGIMGKFNINRQIDLTHYETSHQFLEGTGSMVLDRDNGIAYAVLSPRTDLYVLEDFCRQLNYRPCIFHATDAQGRAIYHTNVMMCVADRFVVICLEVIRDDGERESVIETIRATKKEIIPISLEQMEHFAGNMLQVENAKKEKILVMSTAAYQSLSPEQLTKLRLHNHLLHSPLPTIEANGGGSARCMIAEAYT